MTAGEAVKLCKGSFIKARVQYMRARRWRDADWYSSWPGIAHEWEAVADAK